VVGWSNFDRNADQVILIVPVTSHGQGGHTRPGEILISNPEAYSLTEGSFVRARRIFSIHPKRLSTAEGPIGTLSQEIMVEIIDEIAKLFDVAGPVQVR
jgi:hypothetical protein